MKKHNIFSLAWIVGGVLPLIAHGADTLVVKRVEKGEGHYVQDWENGQVPEITHKKDLSAAEIASLEKNKGCFGKVYRYARQLGTDPSLAPAYHVLASPISTSVEEVNPVEETKLSQEPYAHYLPDYKAQLMQNDQKETNNRYLSQIKDLENKKCRVAKSNPQIAKTIEGQTYYATTYHCDKTRPAFNGWLEVSHDSVRSGVLGGDHQYMISLVSPTSASVGFSILTKYEPNLYGHDCQNLTYETVKKEFIASLKGDQGLSDADFRPMADFGSSSGDQKSGVQGGVQNGIHN
jgi:hypothetical protein